MIWQLEIDNFQTLDGKRSAILIIFGAQNISRDCFETSSSIFTLRLSWRNRYCTFYICWFVMCHLSRKVQDSYCSVQNVQDQHLCTTARNILYTAEESCTDRYGNITNQQIYLSGLTRFVHTCLGLICEIWMFFTFFTFNLL